MLWLPLMAHAMEIPDPPSARRADVPGEIDRLVRDLPAKEPAGRPSSALEVADGVSVVPMPSAAATAFIAASQPNLTTPH